MSTGSAKLQLVSHGREFAVLLLGIAVPVLAWLLIVVDEQRIALRFWPGAPLPHTCVARTVFGVDCPTCGLTRSIVHLAHGRVAESLAMHRLGWFVFGLIVAQVPYRLWRLSGGRAPFASTPRSPPVLWCGLLVLLLLNRLWELVGRL